MPSYTRLALMIASFPVCGVLAAAAPGVIATWSFDDGGALNKISGGPAGKVERARPADGHAGKALVFEDWSVKNYLKPDPRVATRVVVPHDARLNPAPPFRVTAWIYPTADPVYYGGIVEKGQGYTSSYRLVLLRGLKLEGSLGDPRVSIKSASPITLNAWHEVALVTDGKSLTLMVDGAQAAQAALSAPPRPGSTDPLIVGERFTGSIDEVSLIAD